MVEGEGPLVLLLHGFPETSHAWRKQVPALAKRFRIVAPDLRGYGQSEKPRGIGAYRAPVLTGDIAALIHEFGAERAHVVGHDWGGGVACRHPAPGGRQSACGAELPAPGDHAKGASLELDPDPQELVHIRLPAAVAARVGAVPERREGAQGLASAIGKARHLQRDRPRRVRARVRSTWSRDRRAELLPRRAAVTFAGGEDQGADASHLGRG